MNKSSFFNDYINGVKGYKYCPRSWPSRPCSCCKPLDVTSSMVSQNTGCKTCVSGWELAKTTETRTLCTCCRLLLFLWHKRMSRMSLSTQPLWKNFPQGHCAWRPSSPSLALSSSNSVICGLGPGPGWMGPWSALRTHVKWTQTTKWQFGIGTGQDCRHVPNMTHVRSSCHHPAHSLLNTFVRWFASTLFQQFIPKSLTAIPFQREDTQQFHFPSKKRIWLQRG